MKKLLIVIFVGMLFNTTFGQRQQRAQLPKLRIVYSKNDWPDQSKYYLKYQYLSHVDTYDLVAFTGRVELISSTPQFFSMTSNMTRGVGQFYVGDPVHATFKISLHSASKKASYELLPSTRFNVVIYLDDEYYQSIDGLPINEERTITIIK